MKERCEKCDRPLGVTSAARVCSYQCTFCEACAAAMRYICPNCGGQLMPRQKSDQLTAS